MFRAHDFETEGLLGPYLCRVRRLCFHHPIIGGNVLAAMEYRHVQRM